MSIRTVFFIAIGMAGMVQIFTVAPAIVDRVSGQQTGVFLWVSATESTGNDHEWAKCTGMGLIGVRCNEWVNNLPDMFVNNPFGTENRSRKPSIYCLKTSNSPTKQSRQVTVTYADESKSMRTVSLKTEQKKRVKKDATNNVRDKKNGFFDDGLNTFMTTHASRQESRP